jgi:hypothetical protein
MFANKERKLKINSLEFCDETSLKITPNDLGTLNHVNHTLLNYCFIVGATYGTCIY